MNASRFVFILLGLFLALTLSACSDDSNESSNTPTPPDPTPNDGCDAGNICMVPESPATSFEAGKALIRYSTEDDSDDYEIAYQVDIPADSERISIPFDSSAIAAPTDDYKDCSRDCQEVGGEITCSDTCATNGFEFAVGEIVTVESDVQDSPRAQIKPTIFYLNRDLDDNDKEALEKQFSGDDGDVEISDELSLKAGLNFVIFDESASAILGQAAALGTNFVAIK